MPTTYRDVVYLKRHVLDAMKSYGQSILIRRKWTLEDFNNGLVERCSCYDDVYGQSAKDKCPLCFGTTFSGGYRDVESSIGILHGNLSYDFKIEEKGVVPDAEPITFDLYADNIYRDGDLIAIISKFATVDGKVCSNLQMVDDSFIVGVNTLVPLEISDIYEIDGTVKRQELFGMVDSEYITATRPLLQTDSIVSMNAVCKSILPTDIRHDNSFWGL